MVVQFPPPLKRRFDSLGREIPRLDELPESDGIPMENHVHVLQANLLGHLLSANWAGRDFFCGGGTFLHYSLEQVRNKDFLGPDFFVVLDVPYDRRRTYWAVWDEDYRYPDMILEMNSPSTEDIDLTKKKRIYAKTFQTADYVCYDTEKDKLRGWHLTDGRYRAIPERAGGLWCESLQLQLRRWTGKIEGRTLTWLRWFDADGRMLPTQEEKAQAAAIQAEAARSQVEAARSQAEAAAQRASAAEAEIRLLKERLAELTGRAGPDGR